MRKILSAFPSLLLARGINVGSDDRSSARLSDLLRFADKKKK